MSVNKQDKIFKEALSLIQEYTSLWRVDDTIEKELEKPEFVGWRRKMAVRDDFFRSPIGGILQIIVDKCNTYYYSRTRDGIYGYRMNSRNKEQDDQGLRTLSNEEFKEWNVLQNVKKYFSPKDEKRGISWGTFYKPIIRWRINCPDYYFVFEYEKIYHTHYREKDGWVQRRQNEIHNRLEKINGWGLVYPNHKEYEWTSAYKRNQKAKLADKEIKDYEDS